MKRAPGSLAVLQDRTCEAIKNCQAKWQNDATSTTYWIPKRNGPNSKVFQTLFGEIHSDELLHDLAWGWRPLWGGPEGEAFWAAMSMCFNVLYIGVEKVFVGSLWIPGKIAKIYKLYNYVNYIAITYRIAYLFIFVFYERIWWLWFVAYEAFHVRPLFSQVSFDLCQLGPYAQRKSGVFTEAFLYKNKTKIEKDIKTLVYTSVFYCFSLIFISLENL